MQWLNKIYDAAKHLQNSAKHKIYHLLKPKDYLLSRGLTALDIEELSMLHPFSKSQFCVLLDEFLLLCGVNVYDETQNERTISTITMDEMMENRYLKYNPFKERIRVLYEQDLRAEYGHHVMEMTFFDFCQCLSVFASDTPKATKIRFAFRVYDLEDDGFISQQNLFDVLKIVIGEKFEDQTIWNIVYETYNHCTLTADGNIDYHEFNSIVGVADITANFTIPF